MASASDSEVINQDLCHNRPGSGSAFTGYYSLKTSATAELSRGGLYRAVVMFSFAYLLCIVH